MEQELLFLEQRNVCDFIYSFYKSKICCRYVVDMIIPNEVHDFRTKVGKPPVQLRFKSIVSV